MQKVEPVNNLVYSSKVYPKNTLILGTQGLVCLIFLHYLHYVGGIDEFLTGQEIEAFVSCY